MLGLIDIGVDPLSYVLDHLAAKDVARLAAIDFVPELLIARLRRRASAVNHSNPIGEPVPYAHPFQAFSAHDRPSLSSIASHLARIEWLAMLRAEKRNTVAATSTRSFVLAPAGALMSIGATEELYDGYMFHTPTRIHALGESRGDATPIVKLRSIIAGKQWIHTYARTHMHSGEVEFDIITGDDVFGYDDSQFQVALSVDGVVYTWNDGKNCFSGQLGHAEDALDSAVPRIVETLHGYNVVSVAAGSHHCIAVTARGELFSWGVNSDGQCGYDYNQSDEPELQLTPRPVLIGEKNLARGASAGYKHSIVVTTDGDLYAFGSDKKGQLGLGRGNRNVFRPEKVDAIGLLRIVSVAAGSMHSLALTDCGKVYSWGDNEFYQLSRDVCPPRRTCTGAPEQQRDVPLRVSGLDEVCVSVIVAGGTQSGALSDLGVLFTWGFSKYASLGHGNKNDPYNYTGERRARAVVGLPSVVDVSIDSMHGLAVTSDGSVFAWGNSGNFGISKVMAEDACDHPNIYLYSMIFTPIRRFTTEDVYDFDKVEGA